MVVQSKLTLKQGGDPSSTYYNVKPSKRPTEGQVAYFNLRRGYPKELYDGHWCYVLRDFTTKFLVIPITSVKDNSKPNPNFEIDIKIEKFINKKPSRMQVSDIRSLDIQRLNERKDVYNVETDKKYIHSKVFGILALQSKEEMVELN